MKTDGSCDASSHVCLDVLDWSVLVLGNRKTMEVHLEDGSVVSPLEIFDRTLDEDDAILEFVIGERNYQIVKLKLDPIDLNQVAMDPML